MKKLTIKKLKKAKARLLEQLEYIEFWLKTLEAVKQSKDPKNLISIDELEHYRPDEN